MNNDQFSLLDITSESGSQGDFTQMLDALGEFESGKESGDPAQYVAINQLHFIGKYQFGEALLTDLGYYNGDETPYPGSPKNDWIETTWTGKDGVIQLGLDLATDRASYPDYPNEDFSNSDFLGNQTAQENAIRQAFANNITIISSQLQEQGRTIDEFLGETRTYIDENNQTETLTISMSGILAGAHLRGTTSIVDYLVEGTVTEDENETPITQYINNYGGYETPFGTNNSDVLLGTDYNDVLVGFGNNDTLTGFIGADRFRFNSPDEGIDTIIDFNVTEGDKIELEQSNFNVVWWEGESQEFYPEHQFNVGSDAQNEFTRIIYDPANGGLFFDPDGTGNAAQVQVAQLSTGLALTHEHLAVF
ncbi:MAG: calcium-binding protein [Pleurocapsa sp. MO_192.B19]|nr:calcium-binding protein [Pleurocapsa sp. MO_192.B19]